MKTYRKLNNYEIVISIRLGCLFMFLWYIFFLTDDQAKHSDSIDISMLHLSIVTVFKVHCTILKWTQPPSV